MLIKPQECQNMAGTTVIDFFVANNFTDLLGGGYSFEPITQPTCCSTGGF